MDRRNFLLKGFGAAIGGTLIGLGSTAIEENQTPSETRADLKQRFNNNLKFGVFSGVYSWLFYKSLNKPAMSQNDPEP